MDTNHKKAPVGITFIFLLKFSLRDNVVSCLNPTKPPKPYFPFRPPHLFFLFGDFIASSFLNNLQRGPMGHFSTSFELKHHRFQHPITWRYSSCRIPIFVFQNDDFQGFHHLLFVSFNLLE